MINQGDFFTEPIEEPVLFGEEEAVADPPNDLN